MNIKSYLDEYALLQMGMDLYSDRVMGVFDDVPLMDYPLIFMLMSKARQGLGARMPDSMRELTQLLEEQFDAAVISVRVKGGKGHG